MHRRPVAHFYIAAARWPVRQLDVLCELQQQHTLNMTVSDTFRKHKSMTCRSPQNSFGSLRYSLRVTGPLVQTIFCLLSLLFFPAGIEDPNKRRPEKSLMWSFASYFVWKILSEVGFDPTYAAFPLYNSSTTRLNSALLVFSPFSIRDRIWYNSVSG